MILDVKNTSDFGVDGESDNVWRGMNTGDEFEYLCKTFSSASMLGWDYATDADRAAHAANKSFYMTRVK